LFWVWHIFLRNGAQIDNGVCNTVRSSEGDNDPAISSLTLSFAQRAMVNRNIPATVTHQRARIECIDKLEVREIATATYAEEWMRNASRPHAIRYIDYAREFLELSEEREGDIRIDVLAGGVRSRMLTRGWCADRKRQG
jgi:hypothetical protein